MTLKDPTNEVCKCGHLQADHIVSEESLVKHHGICRYCFCKRYTFKSWYANGKEVNTFPGDKEISVVWK